jgi:hypothetical protein
MGLEAYIRKEKTPYDYAIDCPYPDKVIKQFKESTGKTLEYLGKSMTIYEDGKEKKLKKKMSFFKIETK